MSYADKLLAGFGFILENRNDPLAINDGCLVYYYRGNDESKKKYVLRIGNVSVVMWNGNSSITIPNELIIPIAIKLNEMHGLLNWEDCPSFSSAMIEYLGNSYSGDQNPKNDDASQKEVEDEKVSDDTACESKCAAEELADSTADDSADQYETRMFTAIVSVPRVCEAGKYEHNIHVTSDNLTSMQHLAMLKAAVDNMR
jgi:hypothetical protein